MRKLGKNSGSNHKNIRIYEDSYLSSNIIKYLGSTISILMILGIFFASNLQARDYHNVAVYDALNLVNKPNLGIFGLKDIGVIYTSTLWSQDEDRDHLPCKENVLKQVQKIKSKSKLICLDIEHWRMKGEQRVLNQTIINLTTIVSWIKAAYPDVMIGYYGILPIRDYWRAINGEINDGYKEWQLENDKLKTLASSVDVIFPSVYTFFDDRENWVRYANAQIREAKRFGKPVMAFIWPYYHNSNYFKGGKPIPKKFWRLQLDTLARLNVDIVIWASSTAKINYPNEWNGDADWWIETKNFMLKFNNFGLK